MSGTESSGTESSGTESSGTESSGGESSAEIVRASFEAYLAADLATAKRLIAEDFSFTSPQDDHIDRSAFLERCFPTADRFTSHEILELVSDGEDGVFVLYEYALKDGRRYRNTEFITVRNGQLIETQVFFGGPAGGGPAT